VEAIFVTLLVAFPLAGLLSRRWSALALPLLGWPLFYLGLQQGWWGNGIGDMWQYAAAGVLLAGVLSTALAVGLARRVKPRERAHTHFA
jgi:hypothetical protein